MVLFLSVIILPVLTLSAMIGIFLILRPNLAIQIQKKFYEKINWRIEPISMQKELRNTRIMGWTLIIISMFAVGLVFVGFYK